MKKFTTPFVIITVLLLLYGFIFVYSASSIYALTRFGDSFYFVKKQCIGLFVGLTGCILIQMCSAHIIKYITPLLYWGSLICTGCTLIPTMSRIVHGSARWLKIGPLSFQPSELLKIGVVLFVALEISKTNSAHSLRTYLTIISLFFIPALILLLQPDFGLTVTLFLTIMCMFFLHQYHIKYIAYTIGSIIPIAILLIFFKPYRFKRILTFLNPWDDPSGAGFQIIQSLIAIGSGGIYGCGISYSKQKYYYLPMQHTDFIFSIIAEEVGFIGILLLIFLYILFAFYGFRIVHEMNSQFERIASQGFIALLSLQAIINVSVASGLLPTKGIGLPFVSYGNSSLICTLLMVGCIVSFARSSKVA